MTKWINDGVLEVMVFDEKFVDMCVYDAIDFIVKATEKWARKGIAPEDQKRMIKAMVKKYDDANSDNKIPVTVLACALC